MMREMRRVRREAHRPTAKTSPDTRPEVSSIRSGTT